MALTLSCDGKAGDNVDVADGNLLDELSVLGEDLHAGTLRAAVTDHVLAGRANHRHLAWVPQLTLLTTCRQHWSHCNI